MLFRTFVCAAISRWVPVVVFAVGVHEVASHITDVFPLRHCGVRIVVTRVDRLDVDNRHPDERIWCVCGGCACVVSPPLPVPDGVVVVGVTYVEQSAAVRSREVEAADLGSVARLVRTSLVGIMSGADHRDTFSAKMARSPMTACWTFLDRACCRSLVFNTE